VHDGEDLQLVVANSEDKRMRKNLKATLAQLSFEATVHLRAGRHAGFGLLPFCKEADLETFLLLPVPSGGGESFLAGRVVVIHAHGSKGCAKALVDLIERETPIERKRLDGFLRVPQQAAALTAAAGCTQSTAGTP